MPLLVYSTLGGGLTAVDPITSEIRWSIEDGKYRLHILCMYLRVVLLLHNYYYSYQYSNF